MTTIRVPKPPDSAMNKDRPVSSLLRTQMEHLQEAEFRLPSHLQTNVYINAIKTEGEASEYIQQVTARLHEAHARPGRPILGGPGPKKTKTFQRHGLELAAMAASSTPSKRKGRKSSTASRKVQGKPRKGRKP